VTLDIETMNEVIVGYMDMSDDDLIDPDAAPFEAILRVYETAYWSDISDGNMVAVDKLYKVRDIMRAFGIEPRRVATVGEM
jgi:hypothetical protein